MTLEGEYFVSGFGIPHLRGRVVTPGDDSRAVGAERHRSYRARVTLEGTKDRFTNPIDISPVPAAQFLRAKFEEHFCTIEILVLICNMRHIHISCICQSLAFVGDVHFGLFSYSLSNLGAFSGSVGVIPRFHREFFLTFGIIPRLFGFAFQPLGDALLIDCFSPQLRGR